MITALASYPESRFFIEAVFAALVNIVVVYVGHLLHVAPMPALLAIFAFGTILFHAAGVAAYAPFLMLIVLWHLTAKTGVERKKWIGYLNDEKDDANLPDAARIISYTVVPAAFALALPYYYFQPELMILAIVSGLAAATADVVSAEIGVLVNERPLALATLTRAYPGASGAVSFEGIIDGIVAACVAGLAGWLAAGYHFADVWIVVMAANLGNFADSLLAALMANIRHQWVLRHIRKLICTGVACAVAFALARLTR